MSPLFSSEDRKSLTRFIGSDTFPLLVKYAESFAEGIRQQALRELEKNNTSQAQRLLYHARGVSMFLQDMESLKRCEKQKQRIKNPPQEGNTIV